MLFKSKKTERIVLLVGSILLLTPLILGIILVQKEKKELNEYGTETIGVVVKHQRTRLLLCVYEININGKIYTNTTNVGNYDDCPIGTFYKVIYSPENPDISNILLDKPISRDSLAYYFELYKIRPID